MRFYPVLVLILSMVALPCISGSGRLELIQAGQGELIKINNREIRKLTGNVFFRQGDAYLRCYEALFEMSRDRVTLINQVEVFDGKHRLFADRIIYDGIGKTEKAYGHVQLEQEGRFLTADSVFYQQENQQAHAFGEARLRDLLEKAVLSSDMIYFDRIADYGIAYGNPEIIRIDKTHGDSLVIRGITMEGWGESGIAIVRDSVHIRQDDMSAFSSRAVYNSRNEILMLYGFPHMIEKQRVCSGDSIMVRLRQSEFDGGVIYGHAVIHTLDNLYQDSLKGRLMTIQVESDTNRVVIVEKEAENTYHIFNDNEKYEGVNMIDGDRIVLEFKGDKLTYVRVESDPAESRGTFVPAGQEKAVKANEEI
jgi:lipopolysaccharide export system protein LptA